MPHSSQAVLTSVHEVLMMFDHLIEPWVHMTANNKLLWTLLSIVLFASTAASLVQSSGGRVQVEDIKIPTQNGQWLVADLFKPKSATSESPAPLVVVVPGFQRSKESLSNIAIELARRGIVAITIDPYAQGARVRPCAEWQRRRRAMECLLSSITQPTRQT
jgi:hypothetical protein